MALWRAWYDLEPRGEERADIHTAWLIAHLGHNPEGTTVGDILEKIRCWQPKTKADAERKKRRTKKRAKAKLKAAAAAVKAMHEAKNGRPAGPAQEP